MIPVPQSAVDLCRDMEGFHRVVRRGAVITAVPYICPAGFWTIGYGRLCDKDHPPITLEQGEAYLIQDLQESVAATLRACPVLLSEPEHRLAAISSFVFNLGPGRLQTSTLRRRINQGDWQAAGDELLRWVNGGGRKLPGLVRRREAERNLFLTGKWR